MIIPDDVFVKLSGWMCQGNWPYHLQLVLDEHTGQYANRHDLDTFEQMGDLLGEHWVSVFKDLSYMDFLTRETEDGNLVDVYLKKRGRKERAIVKAYLKAIRSSLISLYRVSGTIAGVSIVLENMLQNSPPIVVEDTSASHTLKKETYIAARIVEVKGHIIFAGAILPFEDHVALKLTEYIEDLSEQSVDAIDAMISEDPRFPNGLDATVMTKLLAIKRAAPLISQAWLNTHP